MVADPIDHGGFGMMESADGVHYLPVKAPDIQADFQVPTLEVGGIKKIGSKYYFLGGNANHYGFSGYGVYTYVSDSPAVRFVLTCRPTASREPLESMATPTFTFWPPLSKAARRIL